MLRDAVKTPLLLLLSLAVATPLVAPRSGAAKPLPGVSAEAAEFWRAVRRLPKHQAQAVALYYLEDAPVAEIAEAMGCAESTVKVHLHRGRQALAKRLQVEESS